MGSSRPWGRAYGCAAVGGDELACLSVDDHQTGYSVDLELLVESGLPISVGEWQGEPRNLGVVRVEGILVLVRTHEDYFEPLGLEVCLVPLGELWCEASTRGAPVCRKVDGHCLFTGERFGSVDVAVL